MAAPRNPQHVTRALLFRLQQFSFAIDRHSLRPVSRSEPPDCLQCPPTTHTPGRPRFPRASAPRIPSSDSCPGKSPGSRSSQPWCVSSFSPRTALELTTCAGERYQPLQQEAAFAPVQEDPRGPQEAPRLRPDGRVPEDGTYFACFVPCQGRSSCFRHTPPVLAHESVADVSGQSLRKTRSSSWSARQAQERQHSKAPVHA